MKLAFTLVILASTTVINLQFNYNVILIPFKLIASALDLCPQLVQCWKNIHLQEQYCADLSKAALHRNQTNSLIDKLDECADQLLSLNAQLGQKNHHHQIQLIDCWEKREREHHALDFNDKQVIFHQVLKPNILYFPFI